MKKKILPLIMMVLFTAVLFPVTVFAAESVGNILPAGFPTEGAEGWTYIDGINPTLSFMYGDGTNLYIDGNILISYSATVEWTTAYGYSGYLVEYQDTGVLFRNPSGSGIEEIDVVRNSILKGYKPTTIGQLYVTNQNFPTSGSSKPAWKNDNGKEMKTEYSFFPTGIFLYIGDKTIDTLEKVTYSGGNYVYSNGGITVTFNMTNKVLKSVTVTGYTGADADLNGTYKGEEEPEDPDDPVSEVTRIRKFEPLLISNLRKDTEEIKVSQEYIDRDTFKSELPSKTVIAKDGIGVKEFFDLKVHAADEKSVANQKLLVQSLLGADKEIILTEGIYPGRDLSLTENGSIQFLVWNNLPKDSAGPVGAVVYNQTDGAYVIYGTLDENGTAVFSGYKLRPASTITICR